MSHILEALDRDTKEITLGRKKQRPLSDWELWDFLRQTAGALDYAHAKVVYT